MSKKNKRKYKDDKREFLLRQEKATNFVNEADPIPYELRQNLIAEYSTRKFGLSDFAVNMTNAVTNGDFSNGTTGWSAYGGSTITAINNTLSITGDGTGANPRARTQCPFAPVSGKLYLITVKFKVTNSSCTSVRAQIKNSAGADVSIEYALQTSPVMNTVYSKQVVVTLNSSTGTTCGPVIGGIYPDNATANGKIIEVQEVMCIDLSTPLGLSNEPTATEFADMLVYKGKTFWQGTEPVVINPPLAYNNPAVTLNNAVTNGDFSNGTTGWTAAAGSMSVASNTLSYTSDASVPTQAISFNTANDVSIGKKVYAKVRMRVTNSVCASINLTVDGSTAGTNQASVISNPVINQWYTIGFVATQAADFAGKLAVKVFQTYADAATANGKVMEVQEVMCIDLFTPFGAGNEPTATQFQALLSNANGGAYFTSLSIPAGQVLLSPNGRYYWPDMTLPIYKQMNNLLGTLGDPDNGTVGWTTLSSGVTSSTTRAYKGTTSLKVEDSSSGADQIIQKNSLVCATGDVIYASFYQYLDSLSASAGAFSILDNVGVVIGSEASANMTLSQWNYNSVQRTATGNATGFKYRSGTSATNVSYIDCIHVLNLTTIFGAGNEPSQSQMDGVMQQYIAQNGYLNSGQVDTHLPRHLHAVNVAYDATGGVQAGPPANWLCDGVNDYLVYNSATDIVAANGAVSAFVVFQAVGAIGSPHRIASVNNASGKAALLVGAFPGSISAASDDITSGTSLADALTTTQANKWYSSAGLYDPANKTAKVSLNGGAIISGASITNGCVASKRISIASNSTATAFSNARISEVYLFNKVLTQAEIRQLHNNIASRYPGLSKV